MQDGLFDLIHRKGTKDRTLPTSLYEFVNYGLTEEDYAKYIELTHNLQTELVQKGCILSEIRHTKADKTPYTAYPTLDALFYFCKKKHLISEGIADASDCIFLFRPKDAAYIDRLTGKKYTKESFQFRLEIERKLSHNWPDSESLLIEKLFDKNIDFEYTDFELLPDGIKWVNVGSPVFIKEYTPDGQCKYLDTNELKPMYEAVQKEIAELVHLSVEHDLLAPPVSDTALRIEWLKTNQDLDLRQDVAEELAETLEKAMSAKPLYHFKEDDTLIVYCEGDTCREQMHVITPWHVVFEFYNKQPKIYTVERCSNCLSFRISLKKLDEMIDHYGIPKGNIIYDNDGTHASAAFEESSLFYKMGYSVSQTSDLPAEVRQNILQRAIETGQVTKGQVLRFLFHRMCINGRKKGNELAYIKWKEDFEHFSNT